MLDSKVTPKEIIVCTITPEMIEKVLSGQELTIDDIKPESSPVILLKNYLQKTEVSADDVQDLNNIIKYQTFEVLTSENRKFTDYDKLFQLKLDSTQPNKYIPLIREVATEKLIATFFVHKVEFQSKEDRVQTLTKNMIGDSHGQIPQVKLDKAKEEFDEIRARHTNSEGKIKMQSFTKDLMKNWAFRDFLSAFVQRCIELFKSIRTLSNKFEIESARTHRRNWVEFRNEFVQAKVTKGPAVSSQ